MNTHIAIVTSVLMLTACTPSNRDDSTAEPAQLADAGTTTGTISVFGGMSADNTPAMSGGAHAGDQAVGGQATSADTDTGQGDLGGASSLSDQGELEQPSMVITDSELVDIPIDLWMQRSPGRDPLVYRYMGISNGRKPIPMAMMMVCAGLENRRRRWHGIDFFGADEAFGEASDRAR